MKMKDSGVEWIESIPADWNVQLIKYLFKTDAWRKQIREKASGVKVFSVTQQSLLNATVLFPSEEEQRTISDLSYKKSLIYEYVTGKK